MEPKKLRLVFAVSKIPMLNACLDVFVYKMHDWLNVSARQRATRYLERHLENINDPYEVAITAYALTTAKSPEANAAYGKLLTIKREKGGKVYWSRSEIKINNVRYEFNRPYLQHKVNHYC